MKSLTTLAIAVILFVSLTGCQSTASRSVARYAAKIERAHGINAWCSKPAMSSEITVTLGDNTVLEGTLLMEIKGSRSRIELTDGTMLIFDGTEAWVSPATADFEGARFHLLTWPYFIAVPMKLQDHGATLTLLGEKQLGGEYYDAARLTFDPGTGDTPDDWYVTYADPSTGRLAAMAYIVTYGKTRSEADKEPHMITFDEFKAFDRVVVSTTWRFWHWSHDKGKHGDPIGQVTLSDVKFVNPPANAFTTPPDAKLDRLPTSAG